MVPRRGLELHAEANPKSSVSTNFTTWASRESLVTYFLLADKTLFYRVVTPIIMSA